MAGQQSKKKGLTARFLTYMLKEKTDLFFAILRNTIPNLSLPNNGPIFITRFDDVQEVLSRPLVFNITYAPMIDPSVGPYMLGRDGTTINQRDKGIMRSMLQREDLPLVREMVAALTKEQISRLLPEKKIEVVSNISRMVPLLLTGEYFGFPGPDMESMKRWSRATQYDMFHNQGKDETIHQENIQAGQEMQAYLQELLPKRKAELKENPDLDDTLSRLLKSHFVKEIGFDEERIIANIMGLLVGGGETTSQAIVQILEQFFKRPKSLEEAIEAAENNDDELLFQYCWEALRFNPVNPFVIRRCAETYEVAKGTLRSKVIEKGRKVLVSTRSAMRDGRQLPVASSFCIDRPAYHYMHLGYGMHTCLGDQVSRVQVPEIIKHLILLPNIRQSGKVDFKGGPFPENYVIEFD